MAFMSLSEIDVYPIRRGGIFPSRCTNITNVKESGRMGRMDWTGAPAATPRRGHENPRLGVSVPQRPVQERWAGRERLRLRFPAAKQRRGESSASVRAGGATVASHQSSPRLTTGDLGLTTELVPGQRTKR